MIIGVISGSVVSSHQTLNMNSLPLRIVRKVVPYGEITDTYVVAVDTLGASDGEYVLVASGSTARQTSMTDSRPVDAIIMAIVDTWHIDGEVRYDKSKEFEK